VLVVVLVLENPDRFAIRLTEQISCRTSRSLRSRNPMHRGRARRRGRFQISEFGLNYPEVTDNNLLLRTDAGRLIHRIRKQ
jgi:hypothetical protein